MACLSRAKGFLAALCLVGVSGFPAMDSLVPESSHSLVETHVSPVPQLRLWLDRPHMAGVWCPVYQTNVDINALVHQRKWVYTPIASAGARWKNAKAVFKLQTGQDNPKFSSKLGFTNGIQSHLDKIDKACGERNLQRLQKNFDAFAANADTWVDIRRRTLQDGLEGREPIYELEDALLEIKQRLSEFVNTVRVLTSPVREPPPNPEQPTDRAATGSVSKKPLMPTPAVFHFPKVGPGYFVCFVGDQIFRATENPHDRCANTWMPYPITAYNGLRALAIDKATKSQAQAETDKALADQLFKGFLKPDVDAGQFDSLFQAEFARDGGETLEDCWARLTYDPKNWAVSQALGGGVWQTPFGKFVGENLALQHPVPVKPFDKRRVGEVREGGEVIWPEDHEHLVTVRSKL